MPYYIDSNGNIYGGDRQQRPDGTYDPVAASPSGSNTKWNGNAWVAPTPVNDWAGLSCEFRTPGNALYTSVFAKVDDADRWRNGQLVTLTTLLGLGVLTGTQAKILAASTVKDHWHNFKAFLLSGDLRTTSHLTLGIQQLSSLLTTAGYPLSASDISGWNALLDKYGFPASCKL